MVLDTGIKLGNSLVFAPHNKDAFTFKSTQAISYCNFPSCHCIIGCGKSNAIFVFLEYEIIYS